MSRYAGQELRRIAALYRKRAERISEKPHKKASGRRGSMTPPPRAQVVACYRQTADTLDRMAQ